MGHVFDIAISLGPICRTAHQLRRVYGKKVAPSGIFDWQATDRRAFRAYLNSDFRGMFEREDLFLGPLGAVRNRRTGTAHLHEFPDGIDEASIPLHYARARERHDYLCQRARTHFGGNQRLLLVLGRRLRPLVWLNYWLAVRLAYPRLKFRLVNGPKGDAPHGNPWQGDDAIWDRHLARFTPSGTAAPEADDEGLPNPV